MTYSYQIKLKMSNIKFKGLTKGIFGWALHLHKNIEFG